jgi:hypothetical protein
LQVARCDDKDDEDDDDEDETDEDDEVLTSWAISKLLQLGLAKP